MDAGAAVGSQLLDFGSQNIQNITKTASKISTISRLRRGYVVGTFLGGPLGDPGSHPGPFWVSIFRPKIEKRSSKKA